jgi:uncharacterized membrane protein YfhO
MIKFIGVDGENAVKSETILKQIEEIKKYELNIYDVDGNKTDIQRANYGFRSVLLDEGDHVVEFKYEPMSLYIGILVTVLSAIILIAFWVWRRPHDKIEHR